VEQVRKVEISLQLMPQVVVAVLALSVRPAMVAMV
jgi:hypothetical protein